MAEWKIIRPMCPICGKAPATWAHVLICITHAEGRADAKEGRDG
jgi:hypothetical protein